MTHRRRESGCGPHAGIRDTLSDAAPGVGSTGETQTPTRDQGCIREERHLRPGFLALQRPRRHPNNRGTFQLRQACFTLNALYNASAHNSADTATPASTQRTHDAQCEPRLTVRQRQLIDLYQRQVDTKFPRFTFYNFGRWQ